MSYSADYPWDCLGTVIVSTELIPYQCPCEDHWPWDVCDCSDQPGYDQVVVYACEENWDVDPSDPGDTSNPGGGSTDPIPDDPAITVTIKPEECTERIDGDLNGDCTLDAYELCLLEGNSQEYCSCVSEGGNLNDCCFPSTETINQELDNILGGGNHSAPDCNTDMSNALVFDTAEELESFLETWRNSRSIDANATEVVANPSNPNKVTTRFKFYDFLTIYNVFVEQQLGSDHQFFTDYSVTDITISESGLTLAGYTELNSWQYSMSSYEMTADVYATTSLTIFYKGIGKLISQVNHFRVKTNATDGSRISEEWVN